MSAISSLSGSGMTQWLQQIAQQQSTQAVQTAAAASTSSATGTTGSIASTGSQAGSGSQGVHHGHHHHGGGGGGNFFSQIQQTVTSALQSAQSNGTSDPNEVVEDAFTSLLKNMGFGTNSAAAGTTNSSAGTDSDAADASGRVDSGNSAQQTFQSLLQSVGVSPQQFQSDFLTAVKEAQGGSVNPSTAFSGFPTGTTLDVTG